MRVTVLPEIVALGVYNAALHQRGREETAPRRTTMFELELPVGAGGTSYMDDESARVREDMVICAKPGQLRHTRLPFKCYFVHMIVKDEALSSLLMKLPNYMTLKDRAPVAGLFEAICAAHNTGIQRDALLLHSRLLELIYLLSEHQRETSAGIGRSNKEMIERVIDHINADLTADLSLGRVAAYASFSPVHFHNCFQRSTGKTLREFVEEARLQRAMALLLESDMTLSEIAYAAGFSSQAYFSAVFKKRVGMPPRAYVREMQKRYEK